MMDVASIGIMKEIRRVSDPDKAQIIWDGIKTVRAQKQIPALPRLSRYMNRYQSNLYLTLKVSTLKDHLSSKSSHNFSFKSLSFKDQSRIYFDMVKFLSSCLLGSPRSFSLIMYFSGIINWTRRQLRDYQTLQWRITSSSSTRRLEPRETRLELRRMPTGYQQKICCHMKGMTGIAFTAMVS